MYSKKLKNIVDIKMFFEKALSKETQERIKRFKDSGDFKSILIECNEIIDNIKNLIPYIDYDDINFKGDSDDIKIIYNVEIGLLLNQLDLILSYNRDEDIMFSIFGDECRDLFLELSVNEERFNKIDIINELPIFMRGVGLGSKIYKKMIKHFNYISSIGNSSIFSSMVWSSLATDEGLYMFVKKNGNLICFFKNNLDYILPVLNDFGIDGDCEIDDNFLKDNNLTKQELIELL